MKKLSLVLLALTCTAPVFADTTVPSDAIPLYGYTVDDVTGAACARDLSAGIIQKDADLDVEYKCQAVYYNWQYTRNTVAVSAQVSVSCQERSYDQKVKLSLARSCEKTPSTECFDEKAQAAIQSVSPTKRYNLGKTELEGALRDIPLGSVIIRSPYIRY
jgi:hypothetical protein